MTPRAWRIQGTEVTLPVRIGDASLVGAVFPGRARAARALLDGTGLRPLALGPLTPVALVCLRYRENDLGSYDEVGVALAVRSPEGRYGLFVAELPVTEGFTCEAGQRMWGLPKWVAQCDLTLDGPAAACSLRDGAALVFTAVLRSGARLPWPRPVTVPLPTWAVRDGALHASTQEITVPDLRLRPGGTRVVPGAAHRMAERMRELGLTRPALATLSVEHLAAELPHASVPSGAG